MLFNSYVFVLAFLPITLVGYLLFARASAYRLCIVWLVSASLFFYSWWNPAYLALLIFSILFNFALGTRLPPSRGAYSRLNLAFGVAVNLGLLGYFKYANFFVDSLNVLAGSSILLHEILLPLAISFFTFQQIAYLVDAYRGETVEYDFLHYCLFVTFFPQLIAGPIVHHKEMMPQFGKLAAASARWREHLAVGLTIFAFGLFKKVMIADRIAEYSTPVFNAAESGQVLTLLEAWCGALGYSFQLYFDFSGYSDMAVGLARMFGIRLALNFYSPYKSTSIIDFWRRWHITLSRFLRDYLYIPLGGNRDGEVRRQVNLLATMLLGGLWHGAGWTFVLWGLLHGVYLVINHVWRTALASLGYKRPQNIATDFLSIALTFIAVVVAWVLFRAESMDGAMAMYTAMLGINGVVLPQVLEPILGWSAGLGIEFGPRRYFGSGDAVQMLLLCGLATWLAPNVYQLMRRSDPVIVESLVVTPTRFVWRPNWLWATMAAVALVCCLLWMRSTSEFLYFQF